MADLEKQIDALLAGEKPRRTQQESESIRQRWGLWPITELEGPWQVAEDTGAGWYVLNTKTGKRKLMGVTQSPRDSRGRRRSANPFDKAYREAVRRNAMEAGVLPKYPDWL